jgi:hypothetical protein
VIVITVARKPVEGTVVGNALRHGAGAINITACRLDTSGEELKGGSGGLLSHVRDAKPLPGMGTYTPNKSGRWPANLIIEHKPACHRKGVKQWVCVAGCPVADIDQQSGDVKSTLTGRADAASSHKNPATNLGLHSTWFGSGFGGGGPVYADAGGASRFFKNVGGHNDGNTE